MQPSVDNLFDLPLPQDTRSFYDPERSNAWLKHTVVEGYNKAINKIETPDFKLHVEDLHVQEPVKPFSIKDQKQAVLDKRDLTLPIKGKIQLIDKASGKVVEEKSTTLAHIPYITERNTVIMNGSEYIVTHQQRLKPGVYTRIKGSGEAEAHINVLPGSGLGGKLIFYPEKALFVYQIQTTQIKLYGLLHDLGISDDQMRKAWGEEIFLKNRAAYVGDECEKMFAKVFKYEV